MRILRVVPLNPKREEHCRDALLSDLRGLLPARVAAEPEGEYANDGRADIRVVFGDFNVPVEVKKDRNRQLWSSLNDQLIARYASDPATGGHGIYLVFWFGGEDMPAPPQGQLPAGPVELRERLEAQLHPADKHRISICVVDVSPLKWSARVVSVTPSADPTKGHHYPVNDGGTGYRAADSTVHLGRMEN